jgi:type IV secretory pathway VirB2 component (pilin)
MQTFSSFIMPLAQAGSGSLETVLGKVLKIISYFSYILAFVGIVIGGFKFAKGDTDAGKLSILGAGVMALAGYFVKALFEAAGVQTNIQIQ